MMKALTRMARFAALVLAAGLACASPSARTFAPSHLRPLAPSHPRTFAPSLAVIAWNVHAGRGDVAGVLADVRSGAVIEGAPPAELVMLLQEATDLPAVISSSFLAPVGEVHGRTLGTAILSTLPIEDARAIPLPKQRQPRAAAAATIRLGNEPLVLVSVHLENRGSGFWGGLLSEEARGRQADALMRAIPPGVHGVLGGDLNTWLGPTEPAWRKLVERFPDLPPTRREVTFRDRLVLDHVLFHLPEGWRAERHVLPGSYGSDHRPVVGLIWR